jgi:hypothetical protein
MGMPPILPRIKKTATTVQAGAVHRPVVYVDGEVNRDTDGSRAVFTKAFRIDRAKNHDGTTDE